MGSALLFQYELTMSMAQNAIFTSIFLEKYFEFRKNSKYATGYWCVDNVEAIPMLSQDRNMPNDVPKVASYRAFHRKND